MRRGKYIFSLLALAGLVFFLAQVFSGRWVLPQQFSLGFLHIRFYGLIISLACFCAGLLALRRAPAFGLSPEQAENFLVVCLAAGFLGARLYHVATQLTFYIQHPAQIFMVWQGGLSIYGALAGGVLGVWLLSRRYHTSFWHILDWLAPAVAIGQILGRFGNLFNYELLGYPSSLGMYVPPAFRPPAFANFEFFQPWFLFEALGCTLVLFLLLKLEKRPAFARQGRLFLAYLILYNIVRACLEWLRTDSVLLYDIRLNFVVSLVIVIVAAFLWRLRGSRYGKIS